MYNLRRMTAASDADLASVMKRHGFSHRLMGRGLSAFVRKSRRGEDTLRILVMDQHKRQPPASLLEPVWVGVYTTQGGMELVYDEYHDTLAQYLTGNPSA